MPKTPLSRLRQIRTLSLVQGKTEFRSIDHKGNEGKLLDLASNDYLGLSRHTNLINAAHQTMHSEGVGAGGSRLLTGSRPIHEELEDALCKWLKRESVLIFPSGFQANLAAVIALANRNTTVIADKLIHHSLLIGIKASGAKLKRYSHNDTSDLERLLKLHSNQDSLVITESLFSMEGTSPPLKVIAKLCEKYGARLLVDEAHALGVMGPQGRGKCFEISSPIDIISGTFGKAFGSGGAFLASNKILREVLIQTSGAFRYTTALAPPLAAAALASLDLIKEHPNWGEELLLESKRWRNELTQKGWGNPPGDGPILSLLIGSDQQALNHQKQLEKKGLLSMAIRPPTVPEGTSRLRIVLRRNLPQNTLKKLISGLNIA